MPPRLVALENHHSVLLDKPIMLIGRHDECDIQLESRKVSRRHCCIAQVDKHLVVRDLESTNGIRVNGTPILEGKLQDGDELTIGNLRYRLEWEEVPAAPRREEPKARKQPARAAASPALPVSPDNFMSCDMPVPLKEPEEWLSKGQELALPPVNNGTERAEEKEPKQLPRRLRFRRTEPDEQASASRPAEPRSKEEMPDDRRE